MTPACKEATAQAEIEVQRAVVQRAKEAANAADAGRAAEIAAQRELIRKAKEELLATKQVWVRNRPGM